MNVKIYSLFKKNPEEGFKLTFDTCYEKLVKKVIFIINDQTVAEDIVQEVLLDFWNRKVWNAIEISIEAYLNRAVSYKCIDYLRKNKRATKVVLPNEINDACDLLGEVDRPVLQERINQVINSLPPKCRTIFLLSKYEELPNKAIAAQLNISVKTVENQMTIALKLLRKTLWQDYKALFLLFF